jgi:NAD(P)-dependent dehydrogenase (short-subunit alcohol dehydrogenase family)
MKQVERPQGMAIVTGAAGGMGSPTASRFATQGWPLLLCDLDAARLELIAAPLRSAGAQVEILAGDVARPDFPAQLLAKLGNRAIAALVHTAGISPTLGDGPRIFEVNFSATERLVRAVAPRMAKGSCAVLISSSSAYMAKGGDIDAAIADLMAGNAEPARRMTGSPNAAYPLSKRAIIALVAREAATFARQGARIASIAPGLIDTGMSRSEMKASAQMKVLLEKTPLGRLGSGDEIASVALFLCSPDASYISGCDIKVDGGMLGALGL